MLQLNQQQLRLYLLHNGVYNSQLDTYLSMTATIAAQMSQISSQLSLLPDYQDNPNKYKYNDNICQHISDGTYNSVGFTFTNWNNVNYCVAYDSGILLLGFKAVIQ